MALKQHSAMPCLVTMAFLAYCACSFGQAQPPAAASPAKPPVAAQPATAPSLLDHPAKPAKVTLVSGNLTIDANNSTLTDILQQVSSAGGMKIEGLHEGSADQRIFGSYGPGKPRDVLTSLLNGSGYNFLMVGQTSSGAPRQLALTARPTGGVPNPPPQSAISTREAYEESVAPPTRYPQEPETPSVTPPVPARGQSGIRTPQEILQQLQTMRQQQQEQQQQQQNQEPDQEPN